MPALAFKTCGLQWQPPGSIFPALMHADGIANAEVVQLTQEQFDRFLTTLAAQRRYPSEGEAFAAEIRKHMEFHGRRIEIVPSPYDARD